MGRCGTQGARAHPGGGPIDCPLRDGAGEDAAIRPPTMSWNRLSGEVTVKLSFQILDLSTKHAFRIARLTRPPVRRNVWVRIADEDGVEGWGEAAANVFYGETAETVAAVMPRYEAALQTALAEGATLYDLEDLERAVELTVGRNPAARAAISSALHDLLGKRLGQPVWRLWGLSPAAAPASSFTLGIDDPGSLREKVAEAAGYSILKLKVGVPGDEELLRIVREEAPSATIRVDANTGWTAKQALRKVPLLEELGIELVEQPLAPDDLEGLGLLRRHTHIPIVADESCHTVADIPRLVGAVDAINIKLAKCGSLREAVRMVHVARAHHLGVMLGCMVESTLAVAAGVQLAPLVDYVDLDGAALLAEDPFRGPGLEADGGLRFNDTPGLGVRAAE